MKKFVVSSIFGIALACVSSVAYAEIVTVDFSYLAYLVGENSALGGRTDSMYISPYPSDNPAVFKQTTLHNIDIMWGEFKIGTVDVTQTQFSLNSTTFTHHMYNSGGMDSWAGTGLSTRKTISSGDYTDEMASFTSYTGKGYEGASTYAVVFGGLSFGLNLDDPLTPIVAFQDAVDLVGIAVSPTVYTMQHILDGSGFGTGWTGDEYFNLQIYGFDSDGNEVGMVTQSLDTLRDWKWVDLSTLLGVSYLAFATETNDEMVPNYFAYSHLTFNDGKTSSVPEPATLAIIGLGLAGLGWVRRRK